jgi:hypothetical protein
MTASSPRRPGRRFGALAAPFAWLLVFAALLLLATVATPPRLADEPPLFWIGQTRPLPLPLTPSHAPDHGHAAPPAAGESQP